MNDIMQQQQNASQQISGVIRNFRKIPTRTGKSMAAFTIGTVLAKCFDSTVDTAEQWAETGKYVSMSGHFSNHSGQNELVVQSIGQANQGQTVEQDLPEITAANQAPPRESTTIVKDFSGCVDDIRTINTRSDQHMITFKIGGTACKALGELAIAIQNANGKHVEISGRKDSFQGVTEYAVKTLKTIDGSVVDVRDAATFGNKPVQPTLKPAVDNRPDKPEMEVTKEYIVITIPAGVTQEQVYRITNVANEALRSVGPRTFVEARARVESIHPKDDVEVGELEF
jgi:hypothetical protein